MTNSLELLNERENALRTRARTAIGDLRSELAGFGATKDDLDVLRQAARDLDDLFMLVIVGEFNAGKSALINTLLGADLLEEGVTPTTTAINIVRYGAVPAQRWLGPQVLEREFDNAILRDVAVVDTPGTNAILREHQELTEQFVPRSDLVLFVTSVERPFTESERAFLEAIRGWGKKVVLVINKIDLLRSDVELRQVLEFVGQNVQTLLGFRPQIFPVSARRARDAERGVWASGRQGDGQSERPVGAGEEREEPVGAGGPAGPLAPGEGGTPANDPDFARLRRFITDNLTAENRIKLKLSSPLGVAMRVGERYEAAAHARFELLAEDARTGESIEAQLGYYQEDMRAELTTRLHEVENIVYELSQRADVFFDETFRLGRIFDLINADKIRGEFERKVIANTAERIDQSVDSIAKWVVDREIRLWEKVVEELARRRQSGFDGVVLGQVGGDFDTSRQELIQNVSRSARRVIAGYDRDAEARALGDTMREAVAHTALAEASALGLGALVVFLLGTAAADVTGILAGTLVAGLGMFIIPARKQSVQKKFRKRTDELRMQLSEALTQQLSSELAASVARTQTAVAPYLRFVRSEQDKVSAFLDKAAQLRNEMGALSAEIGSPSFEG